MKKSDKERLKKIISTWDSLKEQIEERGITPEILLQDEFSQWAVTTPLYNIGEQVYQLSSELKQAHTEQLWNMVAGLRHRLVHDYDGINWSIIVEVLFQDMDGPLCGGSERNPFRDGVNAMTSDTEKKSTCKKPQRPQIPYKKLKQTQKARISRWMFEPFPQKRTQNRMKKPNKNAEIKCTAIRRRKRQVQLQNLQANASQGQNGGGWCCKRLRDRQRHRPVQLPL